MVALLVVGVVLLVAAVVAGVLGRRARGRAEAIEATPTTRCAHVGQTAVPGPDARVECVGGATPGPAGLLTAPLSSRECVWYRSSVTEHYWDTDHRRDAQGRTTSHRVRRTRQVSDDRSSAPFAVTDDSGAVAVDPRGARIDQPEKALDRFQDRPREGLLKELVFGSRTIGYQHEEWLIAEGTPLYVNGAAVQRGDGWALAKPPGGGELTLSTRSQDELLAATRRAAKWWSVGAGVLAAAGAAALLAAVVLRLDLLP